jgi:hypothetical protein
MRKNTITANNSLICILTTLFFITALFLFFWFVVSDQFKIILMDKVDVLKTYVSYDPNAKEDLRKKLDETVLDEATFKLNEKKRTEHNTQLFIKEILWWFVVLIILLLACIIYMRVYHIDFARADSMLVFFVLSAFVAEIIFYLVVIKELKFIGDNEVVKTLVT